MKESRPEIFLCYARQDKLIVQTLYKELTNSGFKPWMDVKDILPGELWAASIQNAIRRADFFLACISANSLNRRGFLQKEIREALEIWQGKFEDDIYFIPGCLEKCELPRQMSGFQSVDLFKQQGMSMLMQAIETGLKRRREEAKREVVQSNESETNNEYIHRNSLKGYEPVKRNACSLFGGRKLILRNMTELARYALLRLKDEDIPVIAKQVDLTSEALFAILKRENDIDIPTFNELTRVMDLCIQEALGKPHFDDETRKYWYRQYSKESPMRLVGFTGGEVSIAAANALTLDMYVTLRAIAELMGDSQY